MPRDFDIPNNYLCPINFQIMSDPVVAEDGHTYEREAIEKWLKTNDTSPLSNDKLNHKNLTANHHARSEILNFLDKHPSLYEEDQVYLPQSWVSEFIIAIRQNDVKNATRLLAKHRPLLTAKLEGDDTALHLACKFSSPELVDLILKNLKQRNQLMVTLGINLELIHLNVLLERALNSKDYDKCELLLKLGAGSDAPFICEPGKLSTLHVAARCGDIEILNRLLGAGTPASNDVQDANGDTPLHIAVQVGDAKVILLLLNAGADPAIKNNKNQTPLELAIQEEIKILIVRTVKELNKNKEDKNNLQNVITGQASEIATLKATLSSLSTQKRSLEQKSSIEANELNMFLKLVAEGEQGTAKAMLMNKPRLALLRGNITDLSKRTFIDITGFQYAVWALDWHMWTMIRESLSSDEAKKQAEEFETGPWVKRHGIHAQWILDKLIQAYKVAIDLYEQENFDDGNTAWIEQIGEAQLLLPAHVVNEYCHPERSFYPAPNFTSTSALPRNLDDWFSCVNDPLFNKRGFQSYTPGMRRGYIDLDNSVWDQAQEICLSFEALSSTRTGQRQALITELQDTVVLHTPPIPRLAIESARVATLPEITFMTGLTNKPPLPLLSLPNFKPADIPPPSSGRGRVVTAPPKISPPRPIAEVITPRLPKPLPTTLEQQTQNPRR